MKKEPDFAQYHRLFADNYHAANYGRSLAGILMQMGHSASEKAFNQSHHFHNVLELGAGSGVHLKYVRHSFDQYVMTDSSEQMLSQLQHTAASDTRNSSIEIQQVDAEQPDLQGRLFDRIIATHLLEHLPNPHLVLRRWINLLQPEGVLTLLQPCDPGLAWRLGRTLGPRKNAEKIGIPYDYWMAREHINSIFNVRAMIQYYFTDVQESWHPFRLPSADLNLFYICHIRNSDRPNS